MVKLRRRDRWVTNQNGKSRRLPSFIPVYWPPHSDYEFNLEATILHCHVAWNRLPLAVRHAPKEPTNRVVLEEGILELRDPTDGELIVISPPAKLPVEFKWFWEQRAGQENGKMNEVNNG